MALNSFSIDVYVGQTAVKRIAFSNTDTTQGNFQSIKFTKSENSLFQSGTLILFKGIDEPIINDKVVIKLNGTVKFAGYVASINRSLKGDKLRTLDLIGNTKKLFRSRVTDGYHDFFQNMWTSTIVRELVQYHTSLDHTSIPIGVGSYIDGAYDFGDYIVGDAIKKISQFDNYRLYVNEDDEVQYYEPTAATKTITESDVQSIGSIEKSDNQLFNDITVIGSGTIKAHAEDAGSISKYGIFPETFKEPKLDNQDDATALANKYLDEYKTPRWEGTIIINGDETLDVNQKIRLNLTYLDLDEEVEVVQLEHIITSGKGFQTKINFGRTPYNPGEDFESIRMNIDEDLDQIYDALAAAADAQATADGKIVTFFQDNTPVADGVGDIWFDTNDDNRAYRWDGSNWVLARDEDIVQALADAADAQSTADSKIVTFYQPTAPGSPPAAYGDLWVDTDNKEKLYRYDGGWNEFKKGDVTHNHKQAHDTWLTGLTQENHHVAKVHGGVEFISNPLVANGPYNEVCLQMIMIYFVPEDQQDAGIEVQFKLFLGGVWQSVGAFSWNEWAEANTSRYHSFVEPFFIKEGCQWKMEVTSTSHISFYGVQARGLELKTV